MISSALASIAAPKGRIDAPWGRFLAASAVVALACAGLAALGSGRLAALGALGFLIGVALLHGAFGFGHGFRVLLRDGRSAHARAQLVMLGAAVALFFPALAAGEVFGAPVRGFVFRPGLAVALGAFLFGVGMQVAGGCVSGMLYGAGGGSLRMAIALVAAVVGATLAALAYPVWSEWPSLPAVSLVAELGLVPALVVSLGAFAAFYVLLERRERARHGRVERIGGAGNLLSGPWPYAWAAVALAVLNFATLVVAGRPWGVTQAFAQWGSLAAERLGLGEPVFWPFWEEPTRVDVLLRPLAADATTIMNVAVVAGALAAALAAGRFAPKLRIGLGPALGAVVGGLLLGFGAVVATGCNISAFFSGIASGSLHGWLWIAAALPGNWIGLKLRPLFGLDRPAGA